MVVDFTVENNPDRTVFIAEGLVSGCQIHNAEPSHADPDGTIGIDSLVVRPAMDHGTAHPAESLGLTPTASELHDPSDATHVLALPLSSTFHLPYHLKSLFLNRAHSRKKNGPQPHRNRPIDIGSPASRTLDIVEWR